MDSYDQTNETTLHADFETVTVEAGTFDHALRITRRETEVRNTSHGVSTKVRDVEMWHVNGVGLIKLTSSTTTTGSAEAGWEHIELVSYEIPGNPSTAAPVLADGGAGIVLYDLDAAGGNGGSAGPIAFFGGDLFVFPGETPGASQWYFSYTFKSIFHFAGGNWFYFMEFDAYAFVAVDSGSLANGFWTYLVMPGHSTWAFMGRDGNFSDLRDSTGDGHPDLADDLAGAQVLSGYLFFQTPMPGNPPGGAWHYFEQFDNGNWLVNMTIQNPAAGDWHLLRE